MQLSLSEIMRKLNCPRCTAIPCFSCSLSSFHIYCHSMQTWFLSHLYYGILLTSAKRDDEGEVKGAGLVNYVN